MSLNLNGNILISDDVTSTGVFKSKINTDELVLYLDSKNTNSYPGSGSIWYDLSDYGNDVTLYNSPSFTNGYFSFNGSNNYAKTTNTLDLSNYNTVTVEAIFKMDDTSSGMVYEATVNWNTTAGGFGLYLNSNGSINEPNTHHTNHYAEGTKNYNYTNGTTWNCHLISFSKFSDSYGRAFFVNGMYNDVYTTNNSGTFVDDYFYIGSRGGSSGFLNADISIIRVYGKRLNPYEISENYKADKKIFEL